VISAKSSSTRGRCHIRRKISRSDAIALKLKKIIGPSPGDEHRLDYVALSGGWSIGPRTRLSLRPSSYFAGPACGINAGRTLSPTETRMALTLRPTGMSSPASKEPVEFLIYDDAEEVGRIYKIGGIGTPPDAQWSWSIAVYVDPMLGIATSAKVATLEEAKAQFRQNWQRAKAHSRAYGRSGDADKAPSADT
jgi:hypothetical protein